MILTALMWARIPPGPDNFKRVIKYQTFKTSFYCDFESVTNILFSFEIILGRDLCKVAIIVITVAIIEAFNAFRVLLINLHLHAFP